MGTASAVSIFVPMLALVGWTLLVLMLIPFKRFQAAFRKQVTVADFRYGESASRRACRRR